MKNIKTVLVDKGVSPSFHRISIYNFLVKNRIHPSVDEIYESLVETIPTLSKTTIYNTLKLFTQKGLVKRVTIEENEVRYDADISSHAHFKCNSCGSLFDIIIDNSILKALDTLTHIDGHIITDVHINMNGTCVDCSKN